MQFKIGICSYAHRPPGNGNVICHGMNQCQLVKNLGNRINSLNTGKRDIRK